MNIFNNTARPARLIPALLALAFSAPAFAASWYQIELLLFLNPAPGAGATESQPVYPQSENTVPLQVPRKAGLPYALLPKAERELNAHRLQLNRSGRYESLLHLAWRQPVGSERGADTLSFRIPAYGSDGLDGPARLLGTLRMSRGRFLHADLDVSYLTPQPAAITSAAPGRNGYTDMPRPTVYRFKEKRRMRRNELHYLDSPGLGALIVARRYNPNGTTEQDETEERAESASDRDETKTIEPN